jgi:KUP system potassium uptake protein
VGLVPEPAAVQGVLSLIIWSLVVAVSVKYLGVILRLDNRGEGGIMALLALILGFRRRAGVVVLGLVGAALLYGDGVITPAISVLSAIEGLEVLEPGFAHAVIPATVIVLYLLFRVQRHGTAWVGGIFGPVMLVWFTSIGLLGAAAIIQAPAILFAVNPWHGMRLVWEHPGPAFHSLGGVVLAVTGAEALYADLGHFGRTPIRLAWMALVYPRCCSTTWGRARSCSPPSIAP